MAVYFLQASEGGPVKVGYSQNVARRAAELARALRIELRLVLEIRGTQSFEHELHARFASLRVSIEGYPGNEWYDPSGDLAKFVEVNGGKLIGGSVHDRSTGTKLRDGAILFRKEIAERLESYSTIALAINCGKGSIAKYISGAIIPSDIMAETIEVWSRGRVPRDSWMFCEGLKVSPRLSHPRGTKGGRQKRRAHLDAFRASQAAS